MTGNTHTHTHMLTSTITYKSSTTHASILRQLSIIITALQEVKAFIKMINALEKGKTNLVCFYV
jgi:hypothetical protein